MYLHALVVFVLLRLRTHLNANLREGLHPRVAVDHIPVTEALDGNLVQQRRAVRVSERRLKNLQARGDIDAIYISQY